MHLIESQKRAILELIIALQWADLRYDERDFLALGEIAYALGSRLSDSQLSDMVYQPVDTSAGDPTKLCALAAEVALAYATAVTLERPSRARHEMLQLLTALLQFTRTAIERAGAAAHPLPAAAHPDLAARPPGGRLSRAHTSTSSARHATPEISASKAA
jgi:hypothetical protein